MACPENVQIMADKSVETELELERGNMLTRYLSRPGYISRATGRLRVSLEETITIPTVTTVSAVTTINQIQGENAKDAFLHRQARANWALNVRSRIT